MTRWLVAYGFEPPTPDAFWNALVLLDAAAVVLLVRRDSRDGVVVVASAVMTAGFTANVYAWQVPDWFAAGVAVQAAFLGFVLGVALLVRVSASTGRRPPTG